MVVGQLTLGMAEYQLAHLPGRQRIVVLVHHPEFEICHGFAHRADLAHVVHQDAGGIHHPEPFDDAYTEAALELFPGTWWQPASSTTRTGWSLSSGRGGCLSRM